jgi:hypothetical protein
MNEFIQMFKFSLKLIQSNLNRSGQYANFRDEGVGCPESAQRSVRMQMRQFIEGQFWERFPSLGACRVGVRRCGTRAKWLLVRWLLDEPVAGMLSSCSHRISVL